jgi:hypothetical protein
MSSFLSLIMFEEYTSGEKEKGMHVQIGGKENKKTLRATSHTRLKALRAFIGQKGKDHLISLHTKR